METKSVADVLRKARALIADKGWTQGEPSRDEAGHYAHPVHGNGVCFCMTGAIDHVTGGGPWAVIEVLAEVVGGDVPDWNDKEGRTKEEVLAAFDRAIELARETP